MSRTTGPLPCAMSCSTHCTRQWACILHLPLSTSSLELGPFSNNTGLLSGSVYPRCLHHLVASHLSTTHRDICNLSSLLLWGIWTNRNALLFDNRAVAAKSTLERSILSAREWIAAQVTAPRPTKSPAQHVHQAPVRTDTVRCNTDAAWSATTLRAGIGWHFDDPVSGSHTEGTRSLELISSPLMAEALAMREAIRDAKRAVVTDV